MKPIHIVVLFWTMLVATLSSAAEVRDVRFWRAPDHSRVVFDLSAPVSHEVITLDKPDRLVVDLSKARFNVGGAIPEFENSPIVRLRHAEKPDGKLRVVFDLSKSVQVRSFLLPASAGHGPARSRSSSGRRCH